MSTTEFEHVVADHAEILPAPDPEPSPSGSLLSSLQAKREELAKRGTREERKLVPLWDGALSVVYRYPEGGSDPIIKAAERAQQRGKPSDIFNANCDTLIACAHTIEGRQGDGDWESLDPDSPAPLGFTRRLADLLGIDVPDGVKSQARFILRHVFSPTAATTGIFDGDISLLTQAGELIQWLNGSELSADEALRGE